MTTTTQRRPYVFPSLQTAAEIDPASVEVPARAVDVHGPMVPGLFRPPLRPEFTRALERVLVSGEQPLYWPWAAPPARYYSPEAIVALLTTEGVQGWTARVAEQLRVSPDELTGPLLAMQRTWHAQRQVDQVLAAEQRDPERLRDDPYWAALRHLSRHRAEEYYGHLLAATGTATQRQHVAEVLAAHDGHPFRWTWHLPPGERQQLRRRVEDLDLGQLRVGVARAARLLQARPPDPSLTLANAWTVRDLLHQEGRRVRARLQRLREQARALPARRVHARRQLQRTLTADHAHLDRLDQRLDQLREHQQLLDRQRTTRRAWEAQPNHLEVLAAGELGAERLRLLEFATLLHVEAKPPPYLQATIGAPFPPDQPLGRRAWLRAAWTIQQLRADRGITDPEVALGLEPADAGARHLYDLAHQTLTTIRRDLGQLRAYGFPSKEIAMDLAHEPARLLDELGL